MANITYYRQKRRDGGIRTGIEIEGTTKLGREEGFDDESDPVLLWWVDLRCEGKKLPTDPEEARHWLLEQGPVIRAAFEALAEEAQAGIDFNTFPYLWPVPKTPRGVRMTIAAMANRRLDARAMTGVLLDIAARWQERVEKLPAVLPA